MALIQDNTRDVLAQIRAKVIRGVTAVASAVETDAKLLAPVLTGNHRRSIYSKVTEETGRIVAVISHQSDYGLYLELGTWKMSARPHFRPAFDKNVSSMAAVIARGGI